MNQRAKHVIHAGHSIQKLLSGHPDTHIQDRLLYLDYYKGR